MAAVPDTGAPRGGAAVRAVRHFRRTSDVDYRKELVRASEQAEQFRSAGDDMPTGAMPLRRHPAAPATARGAEPGLEFLYPLQRVKVRWHTLDGGEIAVPGQIHDVDGRLVAVWFDRSAPTFDPMHADDRAWLDVGQGGVVYVV